MKYLTPSINALEIDLYQPAFAQSNILLEVVSNVKTGSGCGTNDNGGPTSLFGNVEVSNGQIHIALGSPDCVASGSINDNGDFTITSDLNCSLFDHDNNNINQCPEEHTNDITGNYSNGILTVHAHSVSKHDDGQFQGCDLLSVCTEDLTLSGKPA